MKQEITSKEWDELSEEAKNIWRNWSYEHKYVQIDPDGAVMPMPTLGQMIEFIKEKKPRLLLELFPTNVYLEDIAIIDYFNHLCEMLWNMVEEILT